MFRNYFFSLCVGLQTPNYLYASKQCDLDSGLTERNQQILL